MSSAAACRGRREERGGRGRGEGLTVRKTASWARDGHLGCAVSHARIHGTRDDEVQRTEKEKRHKDGELTHCCSFFSGRQCNVRPPASLTCSALGRSDREARRSLRHLKRQPASLTCSALGRSDSEARCSSEAKPASRPCHLISYHVMTRNMEATKNQQETPTM